MLIESEIERGEEMLRKLIADARAEGVTDPIAQPQIRATAAWVDAHKAQRLLIRDEATANL